MTIYVNRSTIWVLSAALLIASCLTANAYEPPRSALMIDVDKDTVLFQNASKQLRHPASLTKMMTLYMVFEALQSDIIDMNTAVKGSRFSADRPPSRLGLGKDESITVDLAIDALVVRSANDVAAAVAEMLGGSEEAFAEKMTAKARELGMKDTIYKNASGLPHKEQVTTAQDQAILGIALKKNFPGYFPRFSVPTVSYKDRSWNSHNRLLKKVATVTGIKTGFINASGFNVVTYAEELDGDKIVVVMGGRSAKERDQTVIDLLNRNKPVAQIADTEMQKVDETIAVAEQQQNSNIDDMTTGSISANAIAPYAIQIGALPSQEGAMDRLSSVRPTLESRSQKLRQFTVPLDTSHGIVYRARIIGFENMRAAMDACGVMKVQKIECMPLVHD